MTRDFASPAGTILQAEGDTASSIGTILHACLEEGYRETKRYCY